LQHLIYVPTNTKFKFQKLVPCGTDGRLLEWLSVTRDLDLGSGRTAYRRASLIELYLHCVSKKRPTFDLL